MPRDAHRQRTGRRGETIATAFFESQGFRILERNWRTRGGEIDVIVEKDGVRHFVEVKMRRSRAYGFPEEAVTRQKMVHFQRAVEVYLLRTGYLGSVQLDAFAIEEASDGTVTYRWIPRIGE